MELFNLHIGQVVQSQGTGVDWGDALGWEGCWRGTEANSKEVAWMCNVGAVWSHPILLPSITGP